MNRRGVEIDKSLKYVYFGSSEIESFTEDFMEQLKEVEFFNANGVGLERIDGSFRKLKELLVFWGGENRIEELGEKVFEENSNLEAIYLKFNQISFIHPKAFYGLPQLFVLDLSSNKLKNLDNIFETLKEVVRLDLSGNEIEKLNENIFRNMINLQELKIMKNNFKSLDPKVYHPLANLQSINISFNKSPIRKISGDLFKYNFNLQEIVLMNNQIEIIERRFILNGKPSLNILSLRSNKCVDSDIIRIDKEGQIEDSEIENLRKCFK